MLKNKKDFAQHFGLWTKAAQNFCVDRNDEMTKSNPNWCPNKFGKGSMSCSEGSEKFTSDVGYVYENVYFAPKSCFLSLFIVLQK